MKLLEFFFPRQCVGCSVSWAYLCAVCKKTLQPHPELCPCCHKFSVNGRSCLDCRINRDWFLDGIMIPFAYTDLIKKLILKLKYAHKKDIGWFLAERLALAVYCNSELKNIIVSYVPTHWRRQYIVKWYNQSKILACQLADVLQVPLWALVRKDLRTRSQAWLQRIQRLENLNKAFSLRDDVALRGDETILLVDDVTTTGSTLNEVAKVLKRTFPKLSVWGIVVARSA